jgi:membrane-bound lytic murein transglycosylase B
MTAARTCEQCGKSLEGRSPRTRFCDSACRGKAARQPAKVGTAKAKADAGEKPDDAPAKPTYDTLAEQLKESLTSAQALDTIAGMAALRIAQQIDRGGDTGSAVATLSKELSRLVAEAKIEAAPKIKDAADGILERAAEKMAGLTT